MIIFVIKGPCFNSRRKKRKRNDSGSDVELDITPPPSPDADFEKRRSGRNANKRKKYLDEPDLNLSDDDMANLPEEVKAQMRAAAAASAATHAANAANNLEQPENNENNDQGAPEQSGPNYAFIVSIKLLENHRCNLQKYSKILLFYSSFQSCI